MSVLKLEKIVSFSSEAKKHPSTNLLHGGPSNDPNRKWLAQSAAEDKAFVVVKLQKPSVITAIDIGNDGSAFVEVLVSNDRKEFVRLLPASSFMSPMESRMNEMRTRIRSFSRFESAAAGVSWSYVKFVCSQPFDKTWPFGITFVALRGSTDQIPEATRMDTEASTSNAELEATHSEDESPKAKRFAPNRGAEVDSDGEPASPRKDAKHSGSRGQASNERNSDRTKILDGVVFVLSGFQNPLRSQLRDIALSMGAKYQPDWNSRCTHLVSAFSNTPKWSQVAAVGGRIVTREWLDECLKLQKKLPWTQFKCGKYRHKVQDTAEQLDSDDDVSEEEDIVDDDSDFDPGKDGAEDSDEASGRLKPNHRQEASPKPSSLALPDDIQIAELQNIFGDKRFYLACDIDVSEEKDTLRRYIVGHGGELCSEPESAEYVISWKPGAHSPLWVVKCHQENRIVEE